MISRSLSRFVLTFLVVVTLLAACSPRGTLPAPAPSAGADQQPAAAMRGRAIAFVPNPGLGDPAILFRTLDAAGMVYFGLHEVLLPLRGSQRTSALFDALRRPDSPEGVASPEPASPAMLRLRFEGANPAAQVSGEERLMGVVNYYIGDDPAGWRTQVPTCAGIVYRELYPGIHLSYQGGERSLKGTYVLAPGADPRLIRWRYEGAAEVTLQEGELRIRVGQAGDDAAIIERRPAAWQTIAGRRVAVAVRYVAHRDGSFGFAVGRYDAAQPLTIDPTLDYATYWGASGCEGAYHGTVDSLNNVYIVGGTNVANYLGSTTDCNEEEFYDIFVVKLDPAQPGANQRVYTTYLGGGALDLGVAIDVDAAGNAAVGGYSWSDNFPTTANAYQGAFAADLSDLIAVQLDPQGAARYASYLGGSGFEETFDMDATDDGLIYLTGASDSTDFPTTANAFQRTNKSGDAFVSVVDPSKSGAASLVYSTLFGGTNYDEGYGIAVAGGAIYLAGTAGSGSTDLPLKNPIYPTHDPAGEPDAFAAKFDPSRAGAAQLLFATYLGGSAGETPGGVAVDGAGQMYVVGFTGGPPTSPSQRSARRTRASGTASW